MKIKSKIYIVNNLKTKLILLSTILLVLLLILIVALNIFNNKKSEFVVEVSTINTKNIETIKSTETNILGEDEIEEVMATINLKEYANMPKKIDEYTVIGKIEIPKIGIEKYILQETNEKSLKKSVTKICGPNINKTGNFCIAGHNYKDTFGKISKLENGDIIKITDTYNRTVEYEVYDIKKVKPSDTSCLMQNTNGEREVTLVTCTLGAVKRIIVKAIEKYD